MRGILYGVSVGPGDPEMMTLKACRMIRSCGTVAYPEGRQKEHGMAFRIAEAAVPEILEKHQLPLALPMTRDREALRQAHMDAAGKLEAVLDRGEDVAYLTLGDVTVYSTFSYVQKIVEEDGYSVSLISGVTSFCAASAELGRPLVLGEEKLVVMPSAQFARDEYAGPGTVYALMKSGRNLHEVKDKVRLTGKEAQMVENCGMERQRVWKKTDDIPDRAGYFTTLICR